MFSMVVFNFLRSTNPSAKSWSTETVDNLAFFPIQKQTAVKSN